MEEAVREVVRACTLASDEEWVTFGEVVARLGAAGVERYHADLVRAEKVYYTPDGASEATPCRPVDGAFAEAFSAAGVESAVRAVQAGEIAYGAFCRRVAEAGCVGYHVSLAGRRVVYYGRTGDAHVEWFPGAR